MKTKPSQELKRMAGQLERFTEEGIGSVLADDLEEKLSEACEHLAEVAAELHDAGL